MNWKVIIPLVAFLAYMGPHLIAFGLAMGFHKTIYNQAPGKCRQLPEIAYGSEDIQVLSNGYAFITSGLRILEAIGNPNYEHAKGKVFLFDFNKPTQKAVDLAIVNFPNTDDFNPHGLSVIEKNGKTLLYVVNHLANYSTAIEKFVFEERSLSLVHVKTLLHSHIRYANDVVAIDEDELYYTNYLYTPSSWEMRLGLKWHSVGYCNHGNCRLVVENLLMPNGIIASPDKKFIYTPKIISRSILVYMRKPDNSLTLVQEYPLYVPVDNIDVDQETGDLWCGAHPQGYKTLNYLHDPKLQSPSQVLKLKVKNGLITGMSQVYIDDGSEISASTVAAKHKTAMLVGAVASPPVYCELNYVAP